MHYRNGREAKNGDKVIQLDFDAGRVVGFGVLHSAAAGNDYCNGGIAALPTPGGACLIDCIHIEDLEALLAEKGLSKRPVCK